VAFGHDGRKQRNPMLVLIVSGMLLLGGMRVFISWGRHPRITSRLKYRRLKP